ncbi:MAG TPA: hypothetical protein PLC99_13440 [Verrucomicrobiota bacterium]|nr:hypothetical protein [Verrucomicrobiota bacterium]
MMRVVELSEWEIDSIVIAPDSSSSNVIRKKLGLDNPVLVDEILVELWSTKPLEADYQAMKTCGSQDRYTWFLEHVLLPAGWQLVSISHQPAMQSPLGFGFTGPRRSWTLIRQLP